MLLCVGPRPPLEGGAVEHDRVEGVGGVEVGHEVGVAHGSGSAFEPALGGVGQGIVLCEGVGNRRVRGVRRVRER